MANCMTLTSGICRGCRDNVGGIKRAWFANICDLRNIDKFTVDFKEDDQGISGTGAITDYELISTGKINWYCFRPSKHTGNYVETINISVENGTVYYNGVLGLNYNKAEQAKLNTVFEMSKGDLAMIFEDGNGRFWWLGGLNVTTTGGIPSQVTTDITNGVVIGGTSFQTGTAMADANGGALTFTIDMAHPAMEVVFSAGGRLDSDIQAAEAACCDGEC